MNLVFRFFEISDALIYVVSSFPSSLTTLEKSSIVIFLISLIVSSESLFYFFNKLIISSVIN